MTNDLCHSAEAQVIGLLNGDLKAWWVNENLYVGANLNREQRRALLGPSEAATQVNPVWQPCQEAARTVTVLAAQDSTNSECQCDELGADHIQMTWPLPRLRNVSGTVWA